MKRIKIGARWIGEKDPCFIIAEAGSNHNGSLDNARRLIDVAADAGADAVKFQCFKAEKLYTRAAGASDYLKDSRSIFDMRLMEGIEFGSNNEVVKALLAA